jgi:hypothetical protein
MEVEKAFLALGGRKKLNGKIPRKGCFQSLGGGRTDIYKNEDLFTVHDVAASKYINKGGHW